MRTLGLAALALLLAGLLVACGGSSPHQSLSAREQTEAKQEIDFARCLREHGFDAEVASSGLKISPGNAHGGPEAQEAAQTACARRYDPEVQLVNRAPQQRVEREEAVQRFARCMREHGINVEASAYRGAPTVHVHSHPGSGEPNPESPSFQQTQATCQKLLPKGAGSYVDDARASAAGVVPAYSSRPYEGSADRR
jgi:hypothetical protein